MKVLRPTYWLILSFSLFLFSCGDDNSSGPDNDRGKVLARVGDNYLYGDDVQQLASGAETAEDSAAIVKSYVNNWVKQMLLAEKATEVMPEAEREIDREIQAHKVSLLAHAYEKYTLDQKLDTVVSDAEIEKYYSSNANSFSLKKNIIRLVYVKTRKDSPDLQKVRNWYKSDKPQDRELLQKYCSEHAENCYLDENIWLFFDDLLKEIPIETYNN